MLNFHSSPRRAIHKKNIQRIHLKFTTCVKFQHCKLFLLASCSIAELFNLNGAMRNGSGTMFVRDVHRWLIVDGKGFEATVLLFSRLEWIDVLRNCVTSSGKTNHFECRFPNKTCAIKSWMLDIKSLVRKSKKLFLEFEKSNQAPWNFRF